MAYNRRDTEALVETLDPEIEWHSAIIVPLGGDAAVYRDTRAFASFFAIWTKLSTSGTPTSPRFATSATESSQ